MTDERFEVRLAAEGVPGPDENGPTTSCHDGCREATQEALRKSRAENRGYGVYDTTHDEFLDGRPPREVAADGGRDIEEVVDDGYDEWCDWCQQEYHHGPTWKVEGANITGYFCSRACAEQWKSAAGDVERIDQPHVRADGGQRTTAGGGAVHPDVDIASVLSILDEDNQLYYASGNSSSGTGRALHADEDCRSLGRARSPSSCDAARRPRGHLCSNCTPDDVTVEDIDDALETDEVES